jgi:hypothetical protein
MRFPQVPIGQRFSYQGQLYSKTGPLTASEEGSGAQRMIPRAAEVELIDTFGKPVQETKQRYNRSEVTALLKRCKADLIGALGEMAAGDGSLQLDQVVALIETHVVAV